MVQCTHELQPFFGIIPAVSSKVTIEIKIQLLVFPVLAV